MLTLQRAAIVWSPDSVVPVKPWTLSSMSCPVHSDFQQEDAVGQRSILGLCGVMTAPYSLLSAPTQKTLNRSHCQGVLSVVMLCTLGRVFLQNEASGNTRNSSFYLI